MKEFNTTTICIPSKHYMVDISDRVAEIKKLVDAGKYFTINRARQYGKTTTLNSLKQALMAEYYVINFSLEGITSANFVTEMSFVKAFCRLFRRNPMLYKTIPEEIKEQIDEYIKRKEEQATLDELFITLQEWCEISEKPLVLFIDEVDSAANNQVFLDFLALLRDGYIARDGDGLPTFQSVILAGVTDVKHLKAKIKGETDEKENSPWNVAADFKIDMSLSAGGIKGMLDEYEADHHTGMNTGEIARKIHEYTNGYPFLVSRICQIIDQEMLPERYESLSDSWTPSGVDEAVKVIITENNTLFDSLMGKIRDYDHLRKQLRKILLKGDTIAYLPDNKEQRQLIMYGFIENKHNTISVANRIFEMRLYNYFIGESQNSEELRHNALYNKPEFTRNGELDVPLIMSRFIETQKHIRKLDDEETERKFLEEEGREKFLTYLSPIINGVGTYSIEEQTRDQMRMDVVIHYLGKRYIIELKIWHGERYNEKGEKQIMEYLDHFSLTTGYLLSFSFNKNKEPGVKEVHIGDKTIYEGIV